VAKVIASQIEGVSAGDVYDVAKAGSKDLAGYEVLLFGSSTWGLGDLQDDWEEFLPVVAAADLSGKKVALFGCGDSSSYADSFCSALGTIYQAVKDKATVVGFTETEGYSFDDSEAVVEGRWVGLVLDEDNESDLTESRIASWIRRLKEELGD
jgi:flavodoxin I